MKKRTAGSESPDAAHSVQPALDDTCRAVDNTAADIRNGSQPSAGQSFAPEDSEARATTESDRAPAYDPATNPFTRWIGAFEFGIPDLAENPDKHLMQAYADDHDGPDQE